MKFICIHCRKFIKRKETTINLNLERIALSNVHIPVFHRHCKICNEEVYDARLERKNLNRYIKAYKKQEAKNAK